MDLSIKTLDNNELKVTIDPSDNIKNLKNKIHLLYKYEIDCQILIYLGEILNDNIRIDSIGLKNQNSTIILYLLEGKKNNKNSNDNLNSKIDININESQRDENEQDENEQDENVGDKNEQDENEQDENEPDENEVNENEPDENEVNKQDENVRDKNEQDENEVNENEQDENEDDTHEEQVNEEENENYTIDNAVSDFINMCKSKPLLINYLIQSQTNPGKISLLINTIDNIKIGQFVLENVGEFFILFLSNINQLMDSSFINNIGLGLESELTNIQNVNPSIINTINDNNNHINDNNNTDIFNLNLNEDQKKILENLKILFPSANENIIYEAMIVCNYNEELCANYLFDNLNPY